MSIKSVRIRGRGGAVAVCSVFLVATTVLLPAAEPAGETLTLGVMDPLAAPLACACVRGHAQRQYDKLAAHLEKRVGRKVRVVFGEDLTRLVATSPTGRLDLIIGKQSVVRADAAECHLTVRPLAMLTGNDGKTTLTGLFVVPTGDPAKRTADLARYKILFGPKDSDEKHAAALAALKQAGIKAPEKVETRPGCSDAVLEILDSKQFGQAAVISSYAAPLLEGCGTIPKGALRVIGTTAPVPFITVFATAAVDPQTETKIVAALLAVAHDKALLKVMESKAGFVVPQKADSKKGAASNTAEWPGWRGPGRDGRVAHLPPKLPARPRPLWKKSMASPGLAGIAATARVVIVAGRDSADECDVFESLDAASGRTLWKLQYPAAGKLDYGNSPRATPLIHDGRVYLLGGFGHLHCVNLSDGTIVWKKNLVAEYGAKLVTWGMTASPLLVDGKLIVNPGAKEASLVALDCRDGRAVWKAPGSPAAYASFIVGTFGGVRQIVGYDAISAGGWEPETGRRLWQLFPPERGDFNVPTPIDLGGRLLLTSENNGTRIYGFDASGRLLPTPAARFEDLAPDCSTPVAVGGRLFGCWKDLYCLDGVGLRRIWSGSDALFSQYASLIADDQRVLVTTAQGELLLVQADGGQYQCVSRARIFDDEADVLSHPALVGNRFYVRSATELRCVELE